MLNSAALLLPVHQADAAHVLDTSQRQSYASGSRDTMIVAMLILLHNPMPKNPQLVFRPALKCAVDTSAESGWACAVIGLDLDYSPQ